MNKGRIGWNGPGFWGIFDADQQESSPVSFNITPSLNQIGRSILAGGTHIV